MTLAVWQLHGRQQLRNWWCNQMASAVCAVAALWGTAQVCVAGTVTWAQPALTVARTAFSGHPWWKWVTELFSWVRMLQTRKQVGDRLRSVEAKICNNNRLFDCAYTCLLHWTNFWTRDVQIHQKLKKIMREGGESYISLSLFSSPPIACITAGRPLLQLHLRNTKLWPCLLIKNCGRFLLFPFLPWPHVEAHASKHTCSAGKMKNRQATVSISCNTFIELNIWTVPLMLQLAVLNCITLSSDSWRNKCPKLHHIANVFPSLPFLDSLAIWSVETFAEPTSPTWSSPSFTNSLLK